PKLRRPAGFMASTFALPGSSTSAVVGHCSKTALWVASSPFRHAAAAGRGKRHKRKAIPAHPRPASAPTPNVNWFTLCPENIWSSVAQGGGGLWGAAHSFGPPPGPERLPGGVGSEEM